MVGRRQPGRSQQVGDGARGAGGTGGKRAASAQVRWVGLLQGMRERAALQAEVMNATHLVSNCQQHLKAHPRHQSTLLTW